VSLEGAACSFYSSEQSLLMWPLIPLGQKLAGTGLSAALGRRRRDRMSTAFGWAHASWDNAWGGIPSTAVIQRGCGFDGRALARSLLNKGIMKGRGPKSGPPTYPVVDYRSLRRVFAEDGQ
jgi:hypothetical protein